MSHVLGIDLGTTNSVVAVADEAGVRVLPGAEGSNLVPSVVAFHPSGDVLVGYAARERRLLDARNTVYSIKRLIGRPFQSEEVRRARERFPFALCEGPTGGALVQLRGETYTLPEISAFVLRQIRTNAEGALGDECTRAVITVPANFNELQRSATKAAGRIAGLEVLRILNEPTAAALAYGYRRGSRERIAVYDLGGGTFDVTILELAGDVFEVVATAGDTFLGGDDIDVLLADQMAQAFLQHHRYDPKSDPQAYERLRAAAEWAKCQLSAEDAVQLRVEELAYGPSGVSLDLAFAMNRETFEQLVMPLVARTFDVCEEAMRIASVRPTQLDNVILVGGATRMPIVQRMVREYFGREPLGHIDPDLVVAQGAAVQGHALAGMRDTGTGAPQPLGRVRLKRVTQAEAKAVHPVEPRPAQPAFAPRDQGPARSGSAPPAPPAPLGEASSPSLQDLFEDGLMHKTASHLQPLMSPPPIPPPPGTFAPVHEGAAPPPPPVPAMRGQAVGVPPPPPRAPAPPAVPAGHAPPAPAVVPAAAPGQGVAPRGAPLLLDVTPHSLAIETVGGYCDPVITRNAAIPVEQTRVFSTGQDNQEVVRVRICQGESRRLAENQELGEIVLTGLRPAPRGDVEVAVTFVLDADGTLGVRARDLTTGREQIIRINLVGGLPEEEIARMRQRQSALTTG